MSLVKPGETDGLKTEITQGLSPDDRVVTKGAVLIKPAGPRVLWIIIQVMFIKSTSHVE